MTEVENLNVLCYNYCDCTLMFQSCSYVVVIMIIQCVVNVIFICIIVIVIVF